MGTLDDDDDDSFLQIDYCSLVSFIIYAFNFHLTLTKQTLEVHLPSFSNKVSDSNVGSSPNEIIITFSN
jgi:hypothetical protein